MFNNKKQSKSSSLSNAFMVSAIAFVLVMGTGYSPMQSFGLDYNGIGDLSAFNGLTQSADCFGLGNDCSEDNRVTNNPITPTPDPTPTCLECFTNNLTPEQISTLEDAGMGGVEQFCDRLSGHTQEQLVAELNGFEGFMVSEGIDADTAEAVVDCLLEIFQ